MQLHILCFRFLFNCHFYVEISFHFDIKEGFSFGNLSKKPDSVKDCKSKK